MVSETLGKKMKHAVVSLVATIMAMGTLISFAPSADVYAASHSATNQPGCYYFLSKNALTGLGFHGDGDEFRKGVVNTIVNGKIGTKKVLGGFVYGSGCIDFVMRVYYKTCKSKGGAKFGTSSQISAAKKALKMFENGGTTYKGCSYFMSDKELRSICGVSNGAWKTVKLGSGANESTLSQALKRLGAERGDIIMLSDFTLKSASYTCRVDYKLYIEEEVVLDPIDVEPEENPDDIDDSEGDANEDESDENVPDGPVDGGVEEDIPDGAFDEEDSGDEEEGNEDIGDEPINDDTEDVPEETEGEDEPEPTIITYTISASEYFSGYKTAKKAKDAAKAYVSKLKGKNGVVKVTASYTTYKTDKGTKGAHPWKHTAIYKGTGRNVWMANYSYKKQWGTKAYSSTLTNYGSGSKGYNHVLIFKAAAGDVYKPTYHAGGGKLIAKQEYDDLVAAYGEQYVQEHITFTASADVTVEVIESLGPNGKCDLGNGDDVKHTVTAGNSIWTGNLTDATRKTVTIDGVQYYEFTLSVTKVRLALPDTDLDKSIKVTVTETTDFDALKH